jgi:hypothetical protein
MEDDHLAKIIELTGERFKREFIVSCELGYEHFDERCMLFYSFITATRH